MILGDDIFTIDHVLDPAECQEMRRLADEIGFTEAPITTAVGFVMMPEVRNNTRVMLDDRARAKWLWERVGPHLPPRPEGQRAVGVNERFRFYRYEPGQHFDWHRDGAFRRSHLEWSTLTLIVYLNEDYEGGRTELADIGPIEPRVGRAIVFPHRILHRGAPVERGTKVVMRTDVMVRR